MTYLSSVLVTQESWAPLGELRELLPSSTGYETVCGLAFITRVRTRHAFVYESNTGNSIHPISINFRAWPNTERSMSLLGLRKLAY